MVICPRTAVDAATIQTTRRRPYFEPPWTWIGFAGPCARFCWPWARIPIARACETPDRVARMYAEVFEGLHQDPRGHLQKLFTQKYDEMVLIRDIRLVSFCEHHLLPVVGRAHVAYIPNGKVIGLSKVPRVVDVLAKRPQMQERLTEDLAELLMRELDAKGCCRGDRGEPQLHDDPRSQEARQHFCHECHERGVQGPARDAVGGDVVDFRYAQLRIAPMLADFAIRLAFGLAVSLLSTSWKRCRSVSSGPRPR